MKSLLKMVAGFVLAMGLSLSAATVTYNGSNGFVSNGYYVGPVSLTVDGKNMEGFCYDFFRGVSVGNTWEATVYHIPDMVFGDGFFDNPDLYQQAAWLATRYVSNPNSEWSKIQFAMWNLMAPGAPDVPGQNGFLNAASVQGPNFDATGWYALEDVNGQRQSFLVREVPIVTPEPENYILIGMGLICIAVLRKKY